MAKSVKKEDMSEELKLIEAEAILGVHHMTMMKYIWDGRVKADKNLNGHYRITRGELMRFKAELDAVGGNKSGRKWKAEKSIKRNVRLSLEAAKKVAILGIEQEKSMENVVDEALDHYFKLLDSKKSKGKK